MIVPDDQEPESNLEMVRPAIDLNLPSIADSSIPSSKPARR